jgi:hypothetical protein
MTYRGLFEPDTLITEPLFAARRRGAALSSEKRLMLAVLRSALDDYQKYILATDRIGREMFTAAADWIACTSDQHSFSFESISETLEISPEYFRRGIAAWHRRLLEAPSAAVEPPAAELPQLDLVAS